ncbi:MAG: hypothetical protein SV760_09365, partial [Halobacteria archaeon]|nr:hypothetical protein [Halobacteria archaeon]
MDSERVRSRVGSFFEVYDVQEDDDGEVVKLYGVPLVEPEEVQRRILDEFREESHEIELRHEYGEHVIVAESSEDEEFPWR